MSIFARDRVERTRVTAGLEALAHRGPDSHGQWASRDERVRLGHKRLSIVDLRGGAQPLTSGSENVACVVNGEFYEFQEIRKGLEEKGHRFKTRSDSEILIHLYEEYGVHCVEHLRGEFSFVLWDEGNQCLFAARDRMGVKPLFYSVHQGALYLASEIKGLIAAGVPARWDREAFYQWARTQCLDSDRSYFDGVYQVPPGHYLLATSPSNTRTYCYWDLEYPEADGFSLTSMESAAEAIRAELQTAVRLRLQGDVPVAFYLSGGLDSAATLGLAHHLTGRRYDAFGVALHGDPYDETGLARATAEFNGCNFHALDLDPRDVADAFSEACYHAEVPTGNLHTAAYFHLSRFVRDQGFKVVLTGQGSDELFLGYVPFARDLRILGGAGGQLAGELFHPAAIGRHFDPDVKPPDLDSVKRVAGFVPSWLQFRGEVVGSRLARLFRGDFRDEFSERDHFAMLLNRTPATRRLSRSHPLSLGLYLWAKARLANYLLVTNGDRMEMAHSIEGRPPFLDHHVVQRSLQIRPELNYENALEKSVLRRAVRDVVPEAVATRRKQPFILPPPTGLAAFDELLDSYLDSEVARDQPFFDPKLVLDTVSRLRDDTAVTARKWGSAVTTVLSVLALQERFQPSS